MRNQIKVRLDGNSWVADFSGPIAEDIKDLFGSATVPTAYMAAMPQAEVVSALSAANPDCEVLTA